MNAKTVLFQSVRDDVNDDVVDGYSVPVYQLYRCRQVPVLSVNLETAETGTKASLIVIHHVARRSHPNKLLLSFEFGLPQ
jgi:hypothetical protein